MRTGIWLQRALITGIVTFCILAVTVTGAALWLNYAGYQAMVMQTSSMEPTINAGDIVLARPIPPPELRKGDIIAFTAPLGSSHLVTHRIVDIEQTADGPAFVTRGDNSEVDDPWMFQYEGDGWTLAHTIPWFGTVLTLPQTMAGRLVGAAVTFVTSLILLWPVVVPTRQPRSVKRRTSRAIRPLIARRKEEASRNWSGPPIRPLTRPATGQFSARSENGY